MVLLLSGGMTYLHYLTWLSGEFQMWGRLVVCLKIQLCESDKENHSMGNNAKHK